MTVTAPHQAERHAPDLRLAFVALGLWGAVIAVLHLGFGWGIAIAVVSGGVTAIGLRTDRAWAGVLTAIAIGLTAGAVITSAQAAIRDAEPLHDWVQKRQVVTARVVTTDDPLRLRGGQRETYRIPVRVQRVRDGTETVEVSVRATVFATDAGRWSWERVLPGQELTVRGRLTPADPGTLTAAELAVGKAPKLHGEPPWWQRAAGELRAGLRRACQDLPPEVGGLLPGLALGDVSTIDSGVDGDFRAAGMTHLLAVSGSNVAIVVGAVVLAAAGCGLGRRGRVVLGLLVIVGFVILVRPSPSVLRAAVMGGLGLLVLSRRGGRDAVPILAAAVILLLVVDPGLATNLGFVLSVVATAGLVFFAQRWTHALRDRGWPDWLAAAIAVPVAAQLAVTPVLAAATGSVTPVAVLANALAAVAVPPATVLAVAATVLAPVWLTGAGALVWLASWPARWLIAVADHAASIPSGSVPWPSGAVSGLLLALLIAAVLLLTRWRAGRRLLLVVALGIVAGVVPVRLLTGSWPPSGWVLIACDVGQGDALLLPTGDDSRVIVIDTGPDPQGVDECLRSVGVDRVALLAISHAHADHIGGVTGVYSGRAVEAVLPPVSSHPGLPAVFPSGESSGAEFGPIAAGPGHRAKPRTGTGRLPRGRPSPTNEPAKSATAPAPTAPRTADRLAGQRIWAEAAKPDRPMDTGQRRLDEAIRDTPVVSAGVGDSITVGRTRLDVVAPDLPFAGTRSDPNNNSHVLRATVGGTSILLSGDVEEPAQTAALASGGRLRADVLKVPHHGSSYFDPGFFEAVDPKLAVVSAGKHNDYGHPHPRALRQLSKQGASVFRTDRDGSIAVALVDDRLAVMTME